MSDGDDDGSAADLMLFAPASSGAAMLEAFGAYTSEAEVWVDGCAQASIHIVQAIDEDPASLLWRSAVVLSRLWWNDGHQQQLLPFPRGARVLDLGAGLGLTSMTLEALGAQRVVATEISPALQWLQKSIQRNGSSVEVAELLWGDDDAADMLCRQSGPFDLVLAVDCIYSSALHAPLMRTLRRVLTPGVSTLLLTAEGRNDQEQAFVQQISDEHGMEVKCVAGPDEGGLEVLALSARGRGPANAQDERTDTERLLLLDLPDEILALVVEQCRISPLKALLAVSRRAAEHAARMLRSALACTACDEPIVFFHDLDLRSSQPTTTLQRRDWTAPDGPICQVLAHTGGPYSAAQKHVTPWEKEPDTRYWLTPGATLHCRRCERYLGRVARLRLRENKDTDRLPWAAAAAARRDTCDDDATSGEARSPSLPLFPPPEADLFCAPLGGHRVYLCTEYLKNWPPSAPPRWYHLDEVGSELCCTGSPGGGCGAVIAYTGAVLSNHHVWDAGRGRERALYLNHLVPTAVTLQNARIETLAQGAMRVADAHCRRCGQCVGWHFLEAMGDGRWASRHACQHYEGRHGLVRSAIACEDGDLWEKEWERERGRRCVFRATEESDDEDEHGDVREPQQVLGPG